MQEEVEQRVVTLIVNCSKLTEQELRKALAKLLEQMKSQKQSMSSMGIRVDEEAMRRQLAIRGCEDRASLPFHQALLNGELPYTIGGGIGQSRMCMFFLRKAHIGEVQSSYWPPEVVKECREAGIELL